MHTLVFRFCNLSVAEAYRALLHLQKSSICSCLGLAHALRRPRALSNVTGGHFPFASFVGGVITLLVLCGSFRLQMLAFGGVFEALPGDVILSGISGYCFRGF